MEEKNTILKKVKMSLDTMRPYLQKDGGDIEIVGLSDENVHFYKSNPDKLHEMVVEISAIVKSKKVKCIDNTVWNNNSYLAKWEFMINKIRLKKSIPYLNEIDPV